MYNEAPSSGKHVDALKLWWLAFISAFPKCSRRRKTISCQSTQKLNESHTILKNEIVSVRRPSIPCRTQIIILKTAAPLRNTVSAYSLVLSSTPNALRRGSSKSSARMNDISNEVTLRTPFGQRQWPTLKTTASPFVYHEYWRKTWHDLKRRGERWSGTEQTKKERSLPSPPSSLHMQTTR